MILSFRERTIWSLSCAPSAHGQGPFFVPRRQSALQTSLALLHRSALEQEWQIGGDTPAIFGNELDSPFGLGNLTHVVILFGLPRQKI